MKPQGNAPRRFGVTQQLMGSFTFDGQVREVRFSEEDSKATGNVLAAWGEQCGDLQEELESRYQQIKAIGRRSLPKPKSTQLSSVRSPSQSRESSGLVVTIVVPVEVAGSTSVVVPSGNETGSSKNIEIMHLDSPKQPDLRCCQLNHSSNLPHPMCKKQDTSSLSLPKDVKSCHEMIRSLSQTLAARESACNGWKRSSIA